MKHLEKILTLNARVFIRVLAAFLFLSCQLSCKTVSPHHLPGGISEPGKTWPEASPEDVGIKPHELENFIERIEGSEMDVHGLLIIRSGFLTTRISSRYYDPDNLHDIASATKTIMALLVGIAQAEGLIEGPRQPIAELLPEDTPLRFACAETDLTIGQILSMQSGIGSEYKKSVFEEPSLLTMLRSSNWDLFLANAVQRTKWDKAFFYSSISYHLLSIALTEICGMSAGEYARTRLFDPLGIGRVEWPQDSEGNNHGWGDLKMSLEDFARIALLILNRGQWGESTIVPFEWLNVMLSPHSTALWTPLFAMDYGYGCFLPRGFVGGFFVSMGRGGQCALIFPKQKAIIASCGNFKPDKLIQHSGALFAQQPEDPPKEHEAYRYLLESPVHSPNKGIRIDDWTPYFGSWKVTDPLFGIEGVTISPLHAKSVDAKSIELRIDCPVLPIHGHFSLDGGPMVTMAKTGGDPIVCTAELDSKGALNLQVDQIEGINTFTLTIEIQRDGSAMLTLSEPVLLPRVYSIEMVRTGA